MIRDDLKLIMQVRFKQAIFRDGDPDGDAIDSILSLFKEYIESKVPVIRDEGIYRDVDSLTATDWVYNFHQALLEGLEKKNV